MVEAGVVPAGLDLKAAYTLQFVDHGVGVDHGRPKSNSAERTSRIRRIFV